MLRVFVDDPFIPAQEADQVDTYTGTGLQTEFTLVNKNALEVGSMSQADSTQYIKVNGAYTTDVDAGTVTFTNAPAVNTQIVIPGISSVNFTVFDQDDIDGEVTPREDEQQFFVGDFDSEIGIYKYLEIPNQNGLELTFIDLISSAGADIVWTQLACADANGDPLTYASTGSAIYTAPLNALTTLSASADVSASSCQVVAASGFYEGDYIVVNVGNATEEVVKITAIADNVFSISGFDFEHSVDENVHQAGRAFWAKVTIPLNAAGNEAVNLIDLGLRIKAKKVQRE